jgi:hypothetical protein
MLHVGGPHDPFAADGDRQIPPPLPLSSDDHFVKFFDLNAELLRIRFRFLLFR